MEFFAVGAHPNIAGEVVLVERCDLRRHLVIADFFYFFDCVRFGVREEYAVVAAYIKLVVIEFRNAVRSPVRIVVGGVAARDAR